MQFTSSANHSNPLNIFWNFDYLKKPCSVGCHELCYRCFPIHAIVFEKMCVDDVGCLSLGLTELTWLWGRRSTFVTKIRMQNILIIIWWLLKLHNIGTHLKGIETSFIFEILPLLGVISLFEIFSKYFQSLKGYLIFTAQVYQDYFFLLEQYQIVTILSPALIQLLLFRIWIYHAFASLSDQ
jgi:hypothetical protein